MNINTYANFVVDFLIFRKQDFVAGFYTYNPVNMVITFSFLTDKDKSVSYRVPYATLRKNVIGVTLHILKDRKYEG